MLINTDLSTETASLLRPRTDTGTAAPPQLAPGTQTASQIDPSLQRLTDTTPSAQDADLEIQDEAGADKATSFARLSFLNQPGMAMAAQANQLFQNVLSLLQTTD